MKWTSLAITLLQTYNHLATKLQTYGKIRYEHLNEDFAPKISVKLLRSTQNRFGERSANHSAFLDPFSNL
jgi:hypothetical protein